MRRKPGTDKFEPVSWDNALDEITGHLTRLRDTHGPQSILYYSSSGTKGLLNGVAMDFWRLFGGCTTTYGDLCWPSGLEATRLALGENKHNAPWDIENARLIVLWGKNPAETNIHQTVFINRALEQGAELVVIDPRRTQSAERAGLLIQPRPGSDGAIALAIAHALIRDGRIDREFIDKHVHGFEEFAECVAAFTPQRAAKISDVPEEYIERLADLMGTSRPVTINAGFGMQRYTNSGQTMRAIIALLAITGNIGKPGAGWIFADLQSAVFDDVKDPVAFYPPESPDGVVRVSIATSHLGQGILEASDPPIRMVWVERGNPVTQNPDTNTVLKAFRSLEFRVVVEQFMTDTAREADLVLPAKSMFEQSDVIGAYWHPYIQLKQKILDPPAEVKPETEVYWHLAQRLGLPEADVAATIPAPSDESVEAFLHRKLEPFPEITLEKLAQGPIIAPGHQEIAFSDYRFGTPSGKIELVSNEAGERWGVDPVPGFRELAEPERDYPLWFMTPNTKNRIHSQFNNLRTILAVSPAPKLLINPDDAQDRSIEDGARARIFNDRGELTVTVKFDYGIKRGCVSMTNGWWISQGGTVNFTSLGRATDMGHGAAFHDNRVDVEPT